MNLDSLRDHCLSFPGATENIQWGDDLVFKVGGKMFAVASTQPVEAKVSFKCTPEEFAELVEQDGITPAEYVARYHWVTLLRWDALPDREIRRLVYDSYELVKDRLPKKLRDTITVSGGTATRAARPPGGRSPAPRSRSAAGGRAARTRAK